MTPEMFEALKDLGIVGVVLVGMWVLLKGLVVTIGHHREVVQLLTHSLEVMTEDRDDWKRIALGDQPLMEKTLSLAERRRSA